MAIRTPVLTMPAADMHIDHKAGEKLFVDYAGDRLAVDPDSGKEQPVETFVMAILAASELTYVEASATQRARTGSAPTSALVVPDRRSRVETFIVRPALGHAEGQAQARDALSVVAAIHSLEAQRGDAAAGPPPAALCPGAAHPGAVAGASLQPQTREVTVSSTITSSARRPAPRRTAPATAHHRAPR